MAKTVFVCWRYNSKTHRLNTLKTIINEKNLMVENIFFNTAKRISLVTNTGWTLKEEQLKDAK